MPMGSQNLFSKKYSASASAFFYVRHTVATDIPHAIKIWREYFLFHSNMLPAFPFVREVFEVLNFEILSRPSGPVSQFLC